MRVYLVAAALIVMPAWVLASEAEQLVAAEAVAARECEASAGASEACLRRVAISRRLVDIGWCYGTFGGFPSAWQWHPCGTRKLHPNRGGS